MKNLLIFSLVVLCSNAALASDSGIPMAFIKLQIMNFVAFAALLIFLSKSKIAPVFKQVREDYLTKSQEAQTKLERAKKKRDEIVVSIAKLEEDFQKTVAEAEVHAEVKYQTKIADVKNSIQMMGRDLESQIEGLKRSQVSALKTLLMDKSIEELKADLGSDVDEKLLIQLQNNFVESVVRV